MLLVNFRAEFFHDVQIWLINELSWDNFYVWDSSNLDTFLVENVDALFCDDHEAILMYVLFHLAVAYECEEKQLLVVLKNLLYLFFIQ